MKTRLSKTTQACTLALAALLLSTPVMADRGGKHGRDDDQGWEDRRGGGKHGRDDHRDYRDDRHGSRGGDRGGDLSISLHFGDSHRSAFNDYYGGSHAGRGCPPGLAKKGNGCMPPGQAKKWRMGYALPRDVTRYPLPRDLMMRLPAPPRGHEYVRVAGDILMIAVGSAMVVDAIEDIVR